MVEFVERRFDLAQSALAGASARTRPHVLDRSLGYTGSLGDQSHRLGCGTQPLSQPVHGAGDSTHTTGLEHYCGLGNLSGHNHGSDYDCSRRYRARMKNAELARRLRRVAEARRISPTKWSEGSKVGRTTMTTLLGIIDNPNEPDRWPTLGTLQVWLTHANVSLWTFLHPDPAVLELELQSDIGAGANDMSDGDDPRLLALALLTDHQRKLQEQLSAILEELKRHGKELSFSSARLNDMASLLEVGREGRELSPATAEPAGGPRKRA